MSAESDRAFRQRQNVRRVAYPAVVAAVIVAAWQALVKIGRAHV